MALTRDERITKQKIQLQGDKPFFGWLISRMKCRDATEAERKQMKAMVGSLTVGITKRNEMIFTEWIDTLSDAELKGVMAHEVMHAALMHMKRKTNRNPMIANKSDDIITNNILANDGFNLPKCGIVPHGNSVELETKTGKIKVDKLDKKSTEDIYDEIYKYFKDDDGGKSGGFDSHEQGDEEDVGEGEREDWEGHLVDAMTFAKERGKLPAGMERMVEALLNKQIDWRQKLYKFITNELPYDVSWQRPSRRSISTKIYMPHIKKETIDVVVAIDTSGSIGQDELSQFTGQMISIADSFANIRMTIIVCDCDIHGIYEVKNGNKAKIKAIVPKGGGGTSHEPVYKHIKEKIPNAKVLINLTDGFTSFPNKKDIPSNLKTLWVLTRNSCDKEAIPFGEVVKLR